MKILKDLSVEISDTNSHHWNFEPFESNDGNSLAVGYGSLFRNDLDLGRTDENSKIVLFNNWSPCEYAQRDVKKGIDFVSLEDKFDYVLTICPYTAAWRNLNAETSKYIYAFYPYSVDILPKNNIKKYDVIYHGGIHGKEHVMAMQAMMSRNYRYSSLDYGINPLTRRYLRFATDINLPFKQKIELISECKISISFNLIHVSYKHFRNILKYRSILSRGGEFFDELKPIDFIKNYPWIGVLPQFKTRVHEAAISKCINLVYRDRWNIIEDYYEPEKEFIYFSDERELREKIDYILGNWETESIQSIVAAAYKKSARYTSKNFMEIYSRVIASEAPTNYPAFSQENFWR